VAIVSSALKHFPTAKEGFTTTTSGSVSMGAATVGLNSTTGFSNGEVVVFIIDPTDSNKKQAFTGTIDTSGVQVTGVVWTEGTDQSHSAGATIVDYETATHWALYSRGLLRDHNHSGYHKTLNDDNGNEWIKQSSAASAVNEFTIANAATGNPPELSATGGDTNIGIKITPKGTGNVEITKRFDGWVTGLTTPTTVTCNGNNNYSLVFNSLDLSGLLSPGMRLRATRTVTAPTQCTDLELGSSNYYSKSSPSGMTFTDDFVVSAWVKLESYGAAMTIASRYNGTSGWDVGILSDGRVYANGYNAGAANVSGISTYTIIPLNKWTHVAVQLDMSSFTATTTTSYVMIDGVDAPATVARAGTNPTALVQAGNLEIGGRNGGLQPFDGKLAQVAIYSAKVLQATIQASMAQTLSGSETSLISAYSFNNTINDLNTSNANNLTAQNSAVATNVDSPFSGGGDAKGGYTAGTTDFGEVFNVTFSTNTTVVVQVPAGYTIPTSGGVSAIAYSTSDRPLGWPSRSAVIGETVVVADQTSNSNGSNVDIVGMTTTIYVPPGRAVRLRGEVTMSTAAASSLMSLRLYEGSTFVIDDAVQQPTSGLRNQVIVEAIIWPTAGSHTYKGVLYTNQNANTSIYGAGNVSGGPTRLTAELL